MSSCACSRRLVCITALLVTSSTLTEFSAIFQAGSLIVLVAEVRTRAFLASLVPVIVNTVLNEHQLVLDIVAFVALGDFPRSRLGEKQRGKVLGNWVGRSPKMRTIAQFSIRDPDAEGSVSTVGPADNMGRRESAQSNLTADGTRGGPGSSLRHVESVTNMPVAEEPSHRDEEELTHHMQNHRGFSERSDSRNDLTPTNETPQPIELNTTLEYSPVDRQSYDSPEQFRHGSPEEYRHQMRASYGAPESYNPFDYRPPEPQELDGSSGGGLRVANRSNSDESDNWEQEALRSLNLRR